MSDSKVNPISFRLPPDIHESVHPSVKQAIHDHNNALVDLQKAIASLKSQLEALKK